MCSDFLAESPEYRLIRVEFVRSFLKLCFAGKPAVTSRNVGCFVKLWSSWLQNIHFHTITDTLYAWKVEPNVIQPPLGGFPFNISFTYVLMAHLIASRSPDQTRFLQIETDR